MVRKALVALLCGTLSVSAIAEDAPVDPLDNVLWVFRSSAGSVFWVTARDLTWRQDQEPIAVWVRGDHIRDNTVDYRRSIQRLTLNCKGSVRSTAYTSYGPNGAIMRTWDGFGNSEYIRPGTMAASLEEKFCLGKK